MNSPARKPDAAAAAATAELPLAVWPCAQQTAQWQRHRRYHQDSTLHPGKMLPELARRAISAYSDPGDLVVDPMCGIGTTLVEAIHLDRNALGVELEPRWANLTNANLERARENGASGRAAVIEGDARELPRLVTRKRRLLDSSSAVRRVGAGCADLVLTSPPYGCQIGQIDKPAWLAGRSLTPPESRNYGTNLENLGHARGQQYHAAMAEVYAACAAALKPGGLLVVVTKNLRAGGALNNLAGETIQLCQASGLLYWQHVIALLATIRDSQLVPRPSFFQLTATRKAVARGERIHLVCHEDVLVFRKPQPAHNQHRAAAQLETRRAA